MRLSHCVPACCLALSLVPQAAAFTDGQTTNYSTWMASSIISRGQGVLSSEGDVSALLQAGFTQKVLRRLVEQYPDNPSTALFKDYIKTSVDSVVRTVSNATRDTGYPLDRLSNGNNLIHLYEETGNETYRNAFEALHKSIDLQPRNKEGGLWYYIYPQWSYLDGMYSLTPFYTYYTTLYATDYTTAATKDILFQLDLLWQHCLRDDTGLLVHGYDDSRTAVWADPVTGRSPHVWGRSLGWYAMALVDTLELLPLSRRAPEWQHLAERFRLLAAAIASAADPASGAWWQVLDQPAREGNYIESSGSAMFAYALMKGERLGVLAEEGRGRAGSTVSDRGDVYYRSGEGSSYTEVATKAYGFIVDHFVVNNGNGTLGWNGTVAVCSLNSTASYEYYVGQPILYNSVLGSAAFVLASLEYESRIAGLGESVRMPERRPLTL